MATLKADRRLYLTADRSEVVEEGDSRGAWLLCGAGSQIGAGDVDRYGLSEKGGRIVIGGRKMAPAPENKMLPAAEDKTAEEPADDDEPAEDVPSDWPLDMEPEAYVERYPDGPNADLARQILAARDEGDAGES
jgi:hypothetical protein